MLQHTLTALILIGALFLYWAGFAATSLALLIGGGILECWFWWRVFRLGDRP